MQALAPWLLARATRTAFVAVGLVVVLALQAEPARFVRASAHVSLHARALILSEQARRYLALQYRAFPTEFMGCMIGEIRGNAVIVERIAPADVEPTQSAQTHVRPRQTCEEAGWTGTVGMIHSHPGGERCWYYFPGTQVATSDAASFARQPYAVDAIMCGDRVVWMSRDQVEQQVALVSERPSAPPSRGGARRGTPVRAGSAGPIGGD
jgi:Prokaryotic homologs of the JAB domain